MGNYGKKTIAIFLIAVVFVGNLWSGAYRYEDEMIAGAADDVRAAWGLVENEQNPNGGQNETEEMTYSGAATAYVDKLPFGQSMIEMNGTIARKLNLREIYKDSGGIVLSNGYVVGTYPETSTDYEIGQIMDLKAFLDARGIQLLYVNEPTKYITDRVVIDDLGLSTYINDNTDRFLARLSDNDIPYIDLRDNIAESGKDSFAYFYKTDHHWTTEMGKLAAEAIAQELNDSFGYNIDMTLYDADKFTYREYKEA